MIEDILSKILTEVQPMSDFNSSSLAFIHNLCDELQNSTAFDISTRDNVDIKRGLRNADGTGVMVGCTKIGSVQGYAIMDGEKTPMEGRLIYRGYDIRQLISGFTQEGRFGFEEVAYLLLFGHLPSQQDYDYFRQLLADHMTLPQGFTEDMILKAPSNNIMNKLARSVLVLYSYDNNPDSTDLDNMVRQSILLLSRFPMIVAHAYAAKVHYYDGGSLVLHWPQPGYSIAENFLHSIRPDSKFTQEEARLLDLCLVLHAEHGGGNNSAFTCRVLSSSGTDTYSAIAAAVGSLKGPKHGGANQRVVAMVEDIKAGVSDWKDDQEVAAYLEKILRKEAGDGSGLIYGMGHAIYTMSDPRAVVLKEAARSLAAKTGLLQELELLESIERLTPQVFQKVTGSDKAMCANVDLYSGLVYRMLNIPEALYTPLFAIARIAGWCSHRIEEVMTSNRIIRPAYKSLNQNRAYIPMDQR
jgi:citrate synthase